MNISFERIQQKDEWLTPPYIFQPLGHFDLDPCAPKNAPWLIADKNYSLPLDGLSQFWYGFVWCNPPYGSETSKWLSKMKSHNNGIALVFARTDNRMFHNYVFNADAILFLKGRLSFYTIKGEKGGPAGAPSCLVAYGQLAVKRLEESNLPGKIVYLK